MRAIICMVVLLVPALAFAQSEGKALEQGKRFFPLDAARGNVEKQNGVTIIRTNKPLPLSRTDREALDKGAMRIDRARSVPTPKYTAPMVVHSETKQAQQAVEASLAAEPMPSVSAPDSDVLEPESDAIEGLNESNEPVLALFDDDGMSELLSFSDAMRGVGPSGSRRHLIWPVPMSVRQEITSGYGERNDPFHGRRTFHGGIDIAAPMGTPVLATADGEVIEARADARYGKYIGIKHMDGTISRYGHLSAHNVSEGQRVKAGQNIGAMGSTGRSTGVHLDYRVSRDGMRFDPLSVLTPPIGMSMAKARGGSRNSVVDTTPVRVGVASNPLPKRPLVIKVQ